MLRIFSIAKIGVSYWISRLYWADSKYECDLKNLTGNFAYGEINDLSFSIPYWALRNFFVDISRKPKLETANLHAKP